ncbi:hypothetical protein CK203_061710, partial [Vitis vinifera]
VSTSSELAAISALTFWSMFTGTVTLRWSASNLNHISDDFDSHIHDDLDVLEMEEREGGEAHVGCVHQQPTGKIAEILAEAFEAAYEDLANDDPDVRVDFFSCKIRCKPYGREGEMLESVYSVIAIVFVLVACVKLCDAVTVVDVYRLIQYDLVGVHFGSRLANLTTMPPPA